MGNEHLFHRSVVTDEGTFAVTDPVIRYILEDLEDMRSRREESPRGGAAAWMAIGIICFGFLALGMAIGSFF